MNTGPSDLVAHSSDCAVNDGPAFLPGPCDCGLDLPVDPAKLFRPLFVVGARGDRWEIMQRNVEAFVEAEEMPAGNGRIITVTFHLPDAHGWPACGRSADGVDFSNAAALQDSKETAMIGMTLTHRLSRTTGEVDATAVDPDRNALVRIMDRLFFASECGVGAS